ncbi:MAG: hypothetical protein ACUVQK_15555, partial [Thermogutta sp.]
MTRSPEGGLEEFEEPLRAAANGGKTRILGRPIKTDSRPSKHKNSGKFLGGLTSLIPLFKNAVVGPLPWGS